MCVFVCVCLCLCARLRRGHLKAKTHADGVLTLSESRCVFTRTCPAVPAGVLRDTAELPESQILSHRSSSLLSPPLAPAAPPLPPSPPRAERDGDLTWCSRTRAESSWRFARSPLLPLSPRLHFFSDLLVLCRRIHTKRDAQRRPRLPLPASVVFHPHTSLNSKHTRTHTHTAHTHEGHHRRSRLLFTCFPLTHKHSSSSPDRLPPALS